MAHVNFGCAQVPACYAEIITVFKLGKKCLVVALPLGAESCFNIHSVNFRRADY